MESKELCLRIMLKKMYMIGYQYAKIGCYWYWFEIDNTSPLKKWKMDEQVVVDKTSLFIYKCSFDHEIFMFSKLFFSQYAKLDFFLLFNQFIHSNLLSFCFLYFIFIFIFIIYLKDNTIMIHNGHKGYNDYIQWIHNGYIQWVMQ